MTLNIIIKIIKTSYCALLAFTRFWVCNSLPENVLMMNALWVIEVNKIQILWLHSHSSKRGNNNIRLGREYVDNIHIVQQQIKITHTNLNQLLEYQENVLDLDPKEALNLLSAYKADILKQQYIENKVLLIVEPLVHAALHEDIPVIHQ